MDADKVNSTLAVSLSDAKRKLFEMLQHGEMCQQKAGFRLHRRATREPSPLSLMQEQLWKLETQTPGIPPIYNESVTLRRFGALNPEILERSFAEVIRRHEIWRTSYDTVNGQAVQVLHRLFPKEEEGIRTFFGLRRTRGAEPSTFETGRCCARHSCNSRTRSTGL